MDKANTMLREARCVYPNRREWKSPNSFMWRDKIVGQKEGTQNVKRIHKEQRCVYDCTFCLSEAPERGPQMKCQ